jgi:hypothetical protein
MNVHMHSNDIYRTCISITSTFRGKEAKRIVAVALIALSQLHFDVRQAAVRQLFFLFFLRLSVP